MAKFLRRTWNRYSKLGKRRKKKRVWKRPAGRDNKMREKRRGYPKGIRIGCKVETKLRGKTKGKKIAVVLNLKDLKRISRNKIGVVGAIGKKKKIEVVKKAGEMKVELANINIDSFLKRNNKTKEGTIKKEKGEKK